MPARILLAALLPLVLIACEQAPREQEQEQPQPEPEETASTVPAHNPLLERYLTPFRTPPFHRLEAAHFLPALEQQIEEHEQAVSAISESTDPPTFDNTIEALEQAEDDLSRIARTFFGLIAVSGDPDLHAIAPEFSARLAEYTTAVLFNQDLFGRIESIHAGLDNLDLEPEQRRLVELTFRRFERSGAHLSGADQTRLQEIGTSLAELGGRFDLALREATHHHELLIEDEALLEGLPEALVTLAARSARDRGHESGWVFTLHAHSLYPFLRHFPDREQRETMYQAWIDRLRKNRNQQHDPTEIIHRMAELRAERAELLGFDSHLDYLLADSTIGSHERLRELLDEITSTARARADEEFRQLALLARTDGIDEELQPWDWWYYEERLRETELDLTDAELREWFSLDLVRDGAFALANRLWGLSFHVRTDLPMWDTDVEAFEIRGAMGEHLGVIYLDYRHREGKRGGAWASVYRVQHHDGEDRVAPIVANVANFPPPAAGLPSLLGVEEVRTLFHEFGHALHELFSDVNYRSLAGSAVPADFVEFPAQLLEHWALQPQVLRMYAFHRETGSMITDDAITALEANSRMLGGIKVMQHVAAIELDLALHGVGADEVPDLESAEREVREKLDLPPSISPRHHGTGLASLFSARREGGDYRALWSEVLAADAFAAFQETTILDRNLSEALREEILSRGNSRDPMESWQAFRGRDPEIRYFLEARGLVD